MRLYGSGERQSGGQLEYSWNETFCDIYIYILKSVRIDRMQ